MQHSHEKETVMCFPSLALQKLIPWAKCLYIQLEFNSFSGGPSGNSLNSTVVMWFLDGAGFQNWWGNC